jgi:ABC-type sulfate/molybdate transport systems ATPase subunit
MTTLLACRSVHARHGDTEVLRGVDLEIRQGEVAVLIGPNGAGKSTLIAVAAGLLPVTSGAVERDGRVAAAMQKPALARRTALANVELAISWWEGRNRSGRDDRRTRARNALAAVNAAQLAGRDAATLSGGEARRVHLARVLAVEPDILLLDEPFAGLDPSTRADLLYDTASAIRSDRRATLVVVHDRAEAWALADRVLVMTDGRIGAQGSPRDVFEHPPTEAVAEFVGFTGSLNQGDTVVRLRPSDVVLDPQGPISAHVLRRVPLEDGVRLELSTPGGRLIAVADEPAPEVGVTTRLRLTGGIRFPRATTPVPDGSAFALLSGADSSPAGASTSRQEAGR